MLVNTFSNAMDLMKNRVRVAKVIAGMRSGKTTALSEFAHKQATEHGKQLIGLCHDLGVAENSFNTHVDWHNEASLFLQVIEEHVENNTDICIVIDEADAIKRIDLVYNLLISVIGKSSESKIDLVIFGSVFNQNLRHCFDGFGLEWIIPTPIANPHTTETLQQRLNFEECNSKQALRDYYCVVEK